MDVEATAVSTEESLDHLNWQDIALRAEEIEDEATKDAILKMLAAIKQVRDQTRKKK